MGSETKRAIFTPSEKTILKKLVQQFKSIIASKKSDAITVRKKTQCWDRITEEFNEYPTNSKRTSKQLKKLWDNLKTVRKRELAALKRQLVARGHAPVKLLDATDAFESYSIEIPNAIDCTALSGAEEPHMLLALDDKLPVEIKVEEEGNYVSADPFASVANPIEQSPAPSRSFLSEGREQVRKVDEQMTRDEEMFQLIKEEQKYKTLLAKLKLKAEEEELEFKRKKWQLELEALNH